VAGAGLAHGHGAPEGREFAARRSEGQQNYPGWLVETDERAEWTVGGYVMRMPPDSLAFNDGMFPSVTFRLLIAGAELRGEASLVHDMSVNGRPPDVSRWPVVLRRVSCADVPIRRPRDQKLA